MANNLFKTKSIEKLLSEANAEENNLKKSLSAFNLIMLGIGAVIGAGIFVITGTAAAQHAGPGIVFSFILSGLACAFAGLCYAEFAAMIPIAGSAYTYSYATMGELLAWIIGWDLILEYLFAASTVAVGWSGYVTNFLEKNLGIALPPALINSPYTYDINKGWSSTGAILNLPAVLIVLLMTVLLVRGIKESTTFNNIAVAIKVTVICLFILFGFSYVNPANWTPFIPEYVAPGQFGWSGIFSAAGIIFFAYIGFDAVSTASQEAKNPQRDMPIGIMGSLAICTVLYILVALVMTGLTKYTNLNVASPISTAVDAAGDGLRWLSTPIKLGAISGLSSVILVLLMGQPRIFFTMAKDGLLPSVFSKLHPKYQTPYISTIVTGLVCAVVAGLFPIGILGELVSIGTLLAFTFVCFSIIWLRKTKPEIDRPFKTPLVPLVPILGAAGCIYQMVFLPFDTWIRLFVWLVIGMIIYFTYGAKNSKLNQE
ncbi:MAG: amino acid permease [Candidatus Sericytochromatia bacterium]